MSPTVLRAGHHGPASFVRILAGRTAMLLLVSLAVRQVVGLSAEEPRSESGLLERLRRLGRRGSNVDDPPLADRRLAVPPPNLELEIAAARERARAEAAARPEPRAEWDDVRSRPRWVRRLDEWAEPPGPDHHAHVGFDDGWDPPSAGSQPDSR
jgi:hypothetical protein